MTIVWPDTRADQVEIIRQLYSDIVDLEREYIPATLYNNSTPSQAQIRASWDAIYDYSPLLYSKVVSYKTAENLVNNIHLAKPFFELSWPTPKKNWHLLSSYLKDYESASADVVMAIPPIYQKIVIIGTIRLKEAGATPPLMVRVNGISSANYWYQRAGVYNDGAGAGGFSNLAANAQTEWDLHWVTGDTNDTPLAAQIYLEFPFYTTAILIEFHGKFIAAYGERTTTTQGVTISNLWGFMNLAQILSSITIFDSDGFAPGTKIDMYGVIPL